MALIRHFHRKEFPEFISEKSLHALCVCLEEMNTLLVKEEKILSQIHIFHSSYAALARMITGKSSFSVILSQVHELFDAELALHQQFFELTSGLLERDPIHKNKIKASWKLVVQLQEELHRLGYALGDTVLVKKHGTRALELISKIQKTEIYEFVQMDVVYIKGKVEYIMAHPKENKLAYFLTTVYIVAPFTFETTAVILFFRYLGKYTFSKGKKLKQKFTKASVQ